MTNEKRIRPRRTPTDLLIETLTPIMIFVLVYTVLFFLIDVRYVGIAESTRYVGSFEDDRMLRMVAFFFLMGIVAVNRLVASEGSEESFIFVFGLGGAIGLYTISTPALYFKGSFSTQTGAYLATGCNFLVVAFIWWVTNRLMHECCLDENPTAGDIGILTGTARRVQQAIAARPEFGPAPKETPIFAVNELEAYDPSEKRVRTKQPKPVLDATRRLSKRHPGISVIYFSIPAMLVFAAGFRVLQRGEADILTRGHLYMLSFTIAAFGLLLTTSLAGVREYFRSRRTEVPEGLGVFWIGLGTVMIAMVLLGAAQLPKPGMPDVEFIERSPLVDAVTRGALILLGLFAVYAALRVLGYWAASLAQRRELLPRFMTKAFDALDRLLMRLTQLPKLPKVRARVRVHRDVATCGQFVNPLSSKTARAAMSNEDLVSHAYGALCALAYDLGVPRQEGQTPYEFIDSFPKVLEGLQEEAADLTDLYVKTVYAGQKDAPDIEERLRLFWFEYERTRRHLVR
jgi:hypothetical protein